MSLVKIEVEQEDDDDTIEFVIETPDVAYHQTDPLGTQIKLNRNSTLVYPPQPRRVALEHRVIREMIEMYRDSPCLWDVTSEAYKERSRHKVHWSRLVDKYKEYDPGANEVSVKRKIDGLKSCYKRAWKRVQKSLKPGHNNVHVPNLWYYKYMTFLVKNFKVEKNVSKKTEEKKGSKKIEEEQNINKDSQMSAGEEEPSPPLIVSKRRSRSHLAKSREKSDTLFKEEDNIESRKHKLLDTVEQLVKQKAKKVNSFGEYVGEKLDEIQGPQRKIAEKLIAEVLCLGGLDGLSMETRISSPPESRIAELGHSNHSLLSPPLTQCSPSQIQVPHNTFPSPSHVPNHTPANQTTTSPTHETSQTFKNAAEIRIKELKF